MHKPGDLLPWQTSGEELEKFERVPRYDSWLLCTFVSPCRPAVRYQLFCGGAELFYHSESPGSILPAIGSARKSRALGKLTETRGETGPKSSWSTHVVDSK